jgi:hypothetical protein
VIRLNGGVGACIGACVHVLFYPSLACLSVDSWRRVVLSLIVFLIACVHLCCLSQMAAMGVGRSSHSSGGSTGTHRRRTSEPTLLTSTGTH